MTKKHLETEEKTQIVVVLITGQRFLNNALECKS